MFFLTQLKKTSTAFKYKSNITGVTEVDGADGKVTNTNIAVTKKYLSNFWRLLNTAKTVKLILN